ncbi:RHS repeat-associated core domain-containing protein [Parendozoicomonas sp. Alg238-R29]|uniref:RHS repeat domain-containing protein n=1 Tax=Parendozoicomonas sp. Alg238-R29 TaxID=2993446 RepID=UPI00248EB574|nr:RHS repeat-associated core domain-containing protein [Parendozoicomonas sp. Alg238-R29]
MIAPALTTITIPQNDSTLTLTTAYDYDSHGNVTQTTTNGADIIERRSAASNFLNGQYPQTVTNAIGHSASQQWDTRFGQVTETNDANGLKSRSWYDGFGRVIQQASADGVISRNTYQTCDSQKPAHCAWQMTTSVEHTAASGKAQPDTVVYFDRLGRELRSRSTNLNGDTVLVDSQYDNLGRMIKVSEPYIAGSTVLWNSYSYDLKDREKSMIRADGHQTASTYGTRSGGGSKVTRVHTLQNGDVNTQTHIRENNALGELVKSLDPQNIPVEYRYDAHGNLIWTQVDGNADTVATMSYDLAGNKITMTDPDTGALSYDYDALGQLLSQTDARGFTTTVGYDKLGRMTQRVDRPGNAAQETSTWAYDQGTNAKGQLVSTRLVNSDNEEKFAESYEYDNLARLRNTRTTLTVDGQSRNYLSRSTYDAFGRGNEMLYPSGFRTRNVYDSNGFYTELRNAANDALLEQNTEADNRGNITQQVLGNGLTLSRSFEADSGRMTGINAAKDGASVYGMTFGWDSQGNLQTRSDTFQNVSESFTYDNLNRLTQSSTSGTGFASARVLDYSYDNLGNLTSKTGVGSYSYGGSAENPAGLHAVTSVTLDGTTKTYSYDASGNMIQRAGDTITHTAFNKPSRIAHTGNNAITSFSYDSERRRYYRKDDTGNGITETFTIGGGLYEEIIAPNRTERKAYVGSLLVQSQINDSHGLRDETRYLLPDHLGSVAAIADETGTITERMNFAPFGERRNSDWTDADGIVKSDTTTRGFTGHEMLDDVGLIHMNGRVFDPTLGRFLEADIVVQFPEFSQSFNRYSYVLNGPLSAVDPSGYTLDALPDTGDINNKQNGLSDIHLSHRLSLDAVDHLLAAACAYSCEDPVYLERVSPEILKSQGIDSSDDNGYQAAVFFNGRTGSSYIKAFAGTNGWSDLDDNLANALGEPFGWTASQYTTARKNAIRFQNTYSSLGKLSFAGHSLGGGLATVASLATDIRAIVFNPASVSDSVLNRMDLSDENVDKLVDVYFISGELVTFLQDNTFVKDAGGRRFALEPANKRSTLSYVLNPILLVADSLERHKLESVFHSAGIYFD